VNYTAFGVAAVLLIARSAAIRTMAFMLIMLSFLGAQQSESLRVFFGVFLPTVIHVFIFTGAFVALGALRGRSKPAAASLAIFGLCAVSFFLYVPMLGHAVSSRVREAYQPFEQLNLMMFRALHLSEAGSRDAVYQSAAGLAIMRFIAFAYLYHYLNWFSKTSVIKWNRIAPARALGIVALWMASLWMYANDSRTGLLILMTLSFLHGILELPLDHRTFLDLGRELLARYSQPGDARGTIEAIPDTFYRAWQPRVPPYPD
jgi:hypothetical protein